MNDFFFLYEAEVLTTRRINLIAYLCLPSHRWQTPHSMLAQKQWHALRKEPCSNDCHSEHFCRKSVPTGVAGLTANLNLFLGWKNILKIMLCCVLYDHFNVDAVHISILKGAHAMPLETRGKLWRKLNKSCLSHSAQVSQIQYHKGDFLISSTEATGDTGMQLTSSVTNTWNFWIGIFLRQETDRKCPTVVHASMRFSPTFPNKP